MGAATAAALTAIMILFKYITTIMDYFDNDVRMALWIM